MPTGYRVRHDSSTFWGTLELIYHQTVYEVRKKHRNPLIGLIINIAQTLLMLAGFYVMMSVLRMRDGWLPGDFVLYLLSGIFIFFTHIKAMAAVSSAIGPTSPMALHRPLNTLVVIGAAALAALYLQIVSLIVVLFLYHALITPVQIHNPIGVAFMFILAWFTGLGVGMIFYALKVWFPNLTMMMSSVYSRVNMIASGKMFLGNSLPAAALPLFVWNPLFHIIDQARGCMFINYSPRNSSWEYPLFAGICLLMLSFMILSQARRYASISRSAAR